MEMPKYLFSKKFLTLSVLTIFLFSIPFILIYRPFSPTIWISFRPARQLLFTILFYMIVIVLMALSKMGLYFFQSRHILTRSRFVIWILSEFVVLALVYILLTPYATGKVMPIDLPIVLKTALCVALILAIPYSFLSLYAAYRALKEDYEALKASLSSEKSEQILELFDYKGNPAISLDVDSIRYMEAQDNYVLIYYILDGELQKYMLRCPTQKLESMIEGTSLMRCHRSYIVNLDHVAKVEKGNHRAIIRLDDPQKEISVSKSYYEDFIKRT